MLELVPKPHACIILNKKNPTQIQIIIHLNQSHRWLISKLTKNAKICKI